MKPADLAPDLGARFRGDSLLARVLRDTRDLSAEIHALAAHLAALPDGAIALALVSLDDTAAFSDLIRALVLSLAPAQAGQLVGWFRPGRAERLQRERVALSSHREHPPHERPAQRIVVACVEPPEAWRRDADLLVQRAASRWIALPKSRDHLPSA